MNKIEPKDELNISSNLFLQDLYFTVSIIDPSNNKGQDIYLSTEVTQFNSKISIYQKRILVITNESIFLLRKNSFNDSYVLRRRNLL